jgi:hypothetical protein
MGVEVGMDEQALIKEKLDNFRKFEQEFEERVSLLSMCILSAVDAADGKLGERADERILEALSSILESAVFMGASGMTVGLLREGKIKLSDCVEGNIDELKAHIKTRSTRH